MARKRVIFIAGLGQLIPGSVSSLSQAGSYVKGGLSSITSNGGLSKPSLSGTLINPVVGVTTALLTSTGALQGGLGALGLPQSLQNVVSSAINMGGLFIQLDLNPQRVTEEKDKAQTEIPTDSGYGILHWGLKLTRLTFELQTKSLRPGTKSASITSAANAKNNLDQLKKFYEVNNFNTGLIYENNIYIGHFEGKFRSVRDANDPNIIKSNFVFVIDKQPQVVLPGLGVFNINKLPFSV